MNLIFAVAGASQIAQTYLGHLGSIEGITVKWLYTRDQKHGSAFAGRHGISHVSDNLELILKDENVSALLILTEPSRHLEIAEKAIKSGKHLLIEKPLDLNLERAGEFVEKNKSSEKVISVISQMRFDPELNRIKQELEKRGRVPIAATLNLFHRRDKKYYEEGNQWRQKEAPAILNQGIHYLDIFNWFFGPMKDMTALSKATRPWLKSPDFSTATIQYERGTVATVNCGTFTQGDRPTEIKIYGDDFYLQYPQPFRQNDSLWSRLNKYLQGLSQHEARKAPGNHYRQLTDFIDSIRSNRAPLTDLKSAYDALAVANKICNYC